MEALKGLEEEYKALVYFKSPAKNLSKNLIADSTHLSN